MDRLEGLAAAGRGPLDCPWRLGCRPLANALSAQSRKRRAEQRALQQEAEEARSNAAEAAQRLAVTNEAHQQELRRLREASERQLRVSSLETERHLEETRKLQRDLETEQTRGRALIADFQRLLDSKDKLIASMKANWGGGRNVQGTDAGDASRELQIQMAINLKQKEELVKQEAKMNSLISRQQQTADSLALLEEKHKRIQEEKAKLQIANEKMQEESEQQFRQLILIMKALAEQQAENEALKEERQVSLSVSKLDRHRKVQQLEQQLQQMARDHESHARASSLHQLSLEEQLRAYKNENEGLKAAARRQQNAIEEMETKLQEALEAAAGANAAAAAKSEKVIEMEKELKDKENKLAVISAALQGR